MPVRTPLIVAATAVIVLGACSGSDDSGEDADGDRGTETTSISDTATAPAQGGCVAAETNAAGGSGHVDNGTEMTYAGVPPVSGSHWGQWPEITPRVYTVEDRPELGELVHSHEHGWTIVWYDEALADDAAAMAELEGVSEEVNDAGAIKVVFAPWTSEDGEAFPDDAQIAITHWTRSDDELEVRQFCESASAEAIIAFTDLWPYSDSREPDAP